MIDRICRRITQSLVDKNIIDFEDHEIYMYGLQLFIAMVLKFIGIFAIAYGLGWMKEAVVFTLAFGILRVNAGGYHSSTYFRCFIVTVLAMAVSIGAATYITYYDVFFITISILTISILLVLQYAPVDTPNKPLSSKEYTVYRKRSIAIVIIESLVIVAIYILNRGLIMYCNIAAVAILVESLTLMPVISRKTEVRKEFQKKEV